MLNIIFIESLQMELLCQVTSFKNYVNISYFEKMYNNARYMSMLYLSL